MVKLVKITTPFSGVRILPNYIIACRTGVFLLLLFSRFKLAKENAGGRGVREPVGRIICYHPWRPHCLFISLLNLVSLELLKI